MEPLNRVGYQRIANQKEPGIDFVRPGKRERFSFNLVDADLVELIKIIGNITGKVLAERISEVLDVKSKGSVVAGKPKHGASKSKGKAASSAKIAGEPAGDMTISKILADERTNTLIIVATEIAYFRVLELVKRLDTAISGEGTLHVLKLQHADAEELEKTLTGLTKSAGDR